MPPPSKRTSCHQARARHLARAIGALGRQGRCEVAPIRRTTRRSDRAQLANVAKQAQAVLQTDNLEAVADRGYYDGKQILSCEEVGITVTLPKPMTSGAKADGRFGKQDFVYLAEDDVYRCPAGEILKYYFTAEEHGQRLRRYWTNACRTCALQFDT